MPGPRARTKRGGRPDAKSRHFETVPQLGAVKNKRDGMHYVWVNTDDQLTMGQYLEGGYTVVVNEEGGPNTAGGRTSQVGQDVALMGNVLMQVTNERHEEIVQEGLFGGAGLASADRKMDRYNKDRGKTDIGTTEHVRVEIE